MTYIVSGDSTRDSYNAGQAYIYSTMLAQVGVAYIHNAKGELIYTFAVSLWKKHDVDYVCIPNGVVEVRISLKDSANEGEAVVECLQDEALAELTVKDVYYHGKD